MNKLHSAPSSQGPGGNLNCCYFDITTILGQGLGHEQVKNATKLSYCLEVAFCFFFFVVFFLVQHLLSCCKSLAVFQSSDKVNSNNFCLFFFAFFPVEKWNLELSTCHFTDVTLILKLTTSFFWQGLRDSYSFRTERFEVM